MPSRLRQLSYGAQTLAHSHTFHQLVLPLSGALEIEIDGVAGRLARGTVASIAAGQTHAFSALGPNRFLVLDVAEADFEPAWRSPFLAHPPALPGLALRLLRARREREAGSALLAGLQCRARSAEAWQRIWPALERMQAAPALAHASTDLAALVNLSRSRFHSLFVAATGLTPQAWLSELRLDLAERALREEGAQPSEVALRCGFSEQSALHRALLRERGLTPGQLRRR